MGINKTKTTVPPEIRDANLLLISSTGKLLVEAEVVRRYRDRLLAAIEAHQAEKEAGQHD